MMMWTWRNWASLIIGIILFILGGIPLLNMYGFIGFTLPALPLLIFKVVAIAAGILLVWDAAKESAHGKKLFAVLSFFAGVPILVLGLIPVLNQYGVIGFNLDFVSQNISDIITAAAGIMLFIDAWTRGLR